MEVLASNETFSAPMDATYALLDIEPGSVTTLESYLQVSVVCLALLRADQPGHVSRVSCLKKRLAHAS